MQNSYDPKLYAETENGKLKLTPSPSPQLPSVTDLFSLFALYVDALITHGMLPNWEANQSIIAALFSLHCVVAN